MRQRKRLLELWRSMDIEFRKLDCSFVSMLAFLRVRERKSVIQVVKFLSCLESGKVPLGECRKEG